VETATQELHRLTSYSPGRDWAEPPDHPRARRDFQSNDLSTLPLFYKRYAPALPRLALPRELPVTAAPAMAVLAGAGRPGAQQPPAEQPAAKPGPAELDLPALARLLYWSAGIVRTSARATYTHLFRAAGSAGGRFPLEVYAAVPAGHPRLPGGVHWYDPLEHALVQVGPAPRQVAEQPREVTLVVTGIPWRTGWRYGERGYRHVYWDAGTMLAQTLALAGSAGITAGLYTRFPDAAVAALAGADQVHEWPVALVTLGPGKPVTEGTSPAQAGETDTAPLEFPLVTAAQRAGDCDVLGEPWEHGTAVLAGTQAGPTVDAVIAARGSQRRMNPDRGLPLATLTSCMSVALRGIDVPHWVAVHDVTGLAPGLYRWPDLTAPLREGNLRGELYRVALDQGLSRDAAFVAIAATDVARLSDRDYRTAQLAAGVAEGRLHLAAYALGASATGMTFLDSEIPALLGSAEFPDGLIFTCVGVPDNTSKTAGQPGAPVAVRRVPERELAGQRLPRQSSARRSLPRQRSPRWCLRGSASACQASAYQARGQARRSAPPTGSRPHCRQAASAPSRAARISSSVRVAARPAMRAASQVSRWARARSRSLTPSGESGPRRQRFTTASTAARATMCPGPPSSELPARASVPQRPSSMPKPDSTTRCGRSLITCTATLRGPAARAQTSAQSAAGDSPFTIATSATTALPSAGLALARRALSAVRVPGTAVPVRCASASVTGHDVTRAWPAPSVFRRRVPQLAACAAISGVCRYAPVSDGLAAAGRLARRSPQPLKPGMPVPATTVRTRRKTGPALAHAPMLNGTTAAAVALGGKTFKPMAVVGLQAVGEKNAGLVAIRNTCAVAPGVSATVFTGSAESRAAALPSWPPPALIADTPGYPRRRQEWTETLDSSSW
jgi:SagB-type dehydrogenase family enzyme